MTSLWTKRAMCCTRLLFVFLLACGIHALAPEPTTIAQLEQMLAADHGKSDKDVAKQLGKLELSERLSTLRLERLQTGLPGEKSRQALVVLADASAFQNSWHIYEALPSYRGEISVDPDTGAIFRLTIQTDIPPNHPIYGADVLVEYGLVVIAGQQYVCPTKSVSIARAMNRINVQPGQCADYNCRPDAYVYPKNTAVNDTAYHSYHIFRSEMRILPMENSDVEGVSPQPAPPAATTPQP